MMWQWVTRRIRVREHGNGETFRQRISNYCIPASLRVNLHALPVLIPTQIRHARNTGFPSFTASDSRPAYVDSLAWRAWHSLSLQRAIPRTSFSLSPGVCGPKIRELVLWL